MGLSVYRKKRNFKITSEPKGKAKKEGEKLAFVVQQHSASHLHYDFRLEMEGVLKSWAIPKGPSMNPDDKRLAMMVEDHPFDYKDFEGSIPEGNYGAGNVIVWDKGNYHSIDGDNNDDEKKLLAGLHKGHISFILNGKKLKGEFSLVKLKGKQENAWLLIKKKDKYSTQSDILKKDKSVLSGKKLELRVKSNPKKKIPDSISAKASDEKPRRKISGQIRPMLAELTDHPFDDNDWVFEIKYDGYRAIADLDGKGNVELYSRNLLSFNHIYSSVVEQLKKIDHAAVLDGEVVIEDEKGKSNFQLLQNYQKTKNGILKYYVFDLLSLDGNDLTSLPLIHRKELLKTLLKKYSLKNIIYSEHISGTGISFYEAAVKNHLEGIIGKHSQSPYLPAERSRNWKKIKIVHEQETVIAGITEPKGSRNHFGSLVLGIYYKGKFIYCGNCGTGFNEATLKELYGKLEPIFISSSPFSEKINVPGKVQWVKPKFVCQVKFSEWTLDGSMRHPVFLGLRIDKKPAEAIREYPEEEKLNETAERDAMKTKNKKGNKISLRKSNPKEKKDDEMKIGKVIVKLSNQDKIYFPKEKITKGEIVNYYDEISSVILPYLKDRPQSLHRFPNGINGESFYQKDVAPDKIPSWIKTEKVFSESNNKNIHYIICNDKATLIYLANLGCIEINPWNSKISKPKNPDWVVIDLDPEKISFKEVITAANEVRAVLDELEIEGFCKTSGATGLHIYIPLAAKYDYDIVKNFANLVAKVVNERLPKITSILRMPAKRQGKVYLDFLQNRRGQTLAAPYSVRPKPGAPISTPLEWNEVNNKLDPSSFTIKNIFSRLEKKGDLWKPVISKGVNLEKALKAFDKLPVTKEPQNFVALCCSCVLINIFTLCLSLFSGVQFHHHCLPG